MRAEAPTPFCFGKLPIAGDFLHGVAAVPEFAELDGWIQHGLFQSQQVLGDGFRGRFDALPPLRFVWTAGRGTALAGWWLASRDAVGRRYPFLAGVRVAVGAAQFAALPLALAGYHAALKQLLDTGFPDADVPRVIEQVRALRCECDLDRAHAGLAETLRAVPTATCWRGHQHPPELLLHDLHEAAATVGGPRHSLRWPTRGEAADLAFWLTVLARFGRPTPRLVLWHGDERTPGTARAVLGELAPRQFAGMSFGDLDHDDAYDIGRDFGDADRLRRARERFATAVAAKDAAAALAALPKEGR